MQKSFIACLMGAAAAFARPAYAQSNDFPTKPVRLVIGTAPGGGVEFVARVVSEKLSSIWKVPVVVDSQAGANGVVASQLVSGLAPDGYSLLMMSSAFAINPAMYKLRFDPVADFTAIVQLTSAPYVITVEASLPANSLSELVELAKRKPGSLNYSSPGMGSPGHLAAELFNRATSVNMVHVPYKGAGPATIALESAEVQVYFGSPPSVNRALGNGRVRALAVTSVKRSSMLPNVPTAEEAGIKGYSVVGWYGIFGPAKMPAARVAVINETTSKVLQMPDVIARLRQDGSEAGGGSPQDFATLVVNDLARWKDVAARAGIKPE
jgi:tripartite-type tricarboxylate transporter receptor subunit TctC